MLDHEKRKAILHADWHILFVSDCKMLPSPFIVASVFGKMPIQNMLTAFIYIPLIHQSVIWHVDIKQSLVIYQQ
jgi:hypothetical protein